MRLRAHFHVASTASGTLIYGLWSVRRLRRLGELGSAKLTQAGPILPGKTSHQIDVRQFGWDGVGNRFEQRQRKLSELDRNVPFPCSFSCSADGRRRYEDFDARLVDERVDGIGLRREEHGTHSLRRTKASIIYKATGNLRAVQILLGHTKIEKTVRYLGVDVEDALALAEGTEI
jgi:integrase